MKTLDLYILGKSPKLTFIVIVLDGGPFYSIVLGPYFGLERQTRSSDLGYDETSSLGNGISPTFCISSFSLYLIVPSQNGSRLQMQVRYGSDI